MNVARQLIPTKYIMKTISRPDLLTWSRVIDLLITDLRSLRALRTENFDISVIIFVRAWRNNVYIYIRDLFDGRWKNTIRFPGRDRGTERKTWKWNDGHQHFIGEPYFSVNFWKNVVGSDVITS